MMRIAPTIVKDKLETAMKKVDTIRELYVQNPRADFTRLRKFSFRSILEIMMKFGGHSLQNEISELYVPTNSFDHSVPTKSAFIQQRDKILPGAGYFLLQSFTNSLLFPLTYNGYRLLACDGSDIPIPRNPDEADFSVVTREDRKSYNMMHMNGLFDVLNRIFVDCIIDPGMHARERLALAQMVSRLPEPEKAIIVADRGYDGYNCIAHMIESNANYAVRTKDIESTGFLQSLSLPSTDEFDVDIKKTLTFNVPKSHKDDNTYTKVFRGHFDFLENSKTYDIHFRVVRFKLSNGTYECIVTNLSREAFPPEELKKLYHLRWMIENAYRDLKYTIDLLHFHGKSANAIILELYCTLTFFNFCAYIAVHSDPIDHSSKTKYRYKVNFAIAVGSCRQFLHGSYSESELLSRLKLAPTPIRDNRSVPRPSRMKEQSSREFNYRAS